jgi:hypothetical protein
MNGSHGHVRLVSLLQHAAVPPVVTPRPRGAVMHGGQMAVQVDPYASNARKRSVVARTVCELHLSSEGAAS